MKQMLEIQRRKIRKLNRELANLKAAHLELLEKEAVFREKPNEFRRHDMMITARKLKRIASR